MEYKCISADCHIDLVWLPPGLFTENARTAMRDRMPYVVDSDDGPLWVTKQGARFGFMNGMGSGGRKYVPGQIHRSDRMAETGLFSDGARGIRRLTDPALRIADQDRDGIQAEVLYGILGASQRLNDQEAATEVMRIYNEWLDGFCKAAPDRFAGLASIPNHDMEAAVAEIRHVANRGGVRGVEVSKTHDMKPLYDPSYAPIWEAASEAGLPVHFHTIGGQRPNFEDLPPLQARQAFAIHITGFQLAMAHTLMEIIYGGVLESYPTLKVVIGEAGIGWIPYILQHMDLEWEDQFKDLTLTMKPSDYWRRQCRATYQSDRVGVRLLDILGEETVMWGSDFPHPDGVWPDSQEFIGREFADMPEALRYKVTCENAGKFYGLM